MTDYLVKAEADFDRKVAEIKAEFAKQAKRVNRSSEVRTRQALRAIAADVYCPYRDASLESAKTDVSGV